MLSTSFAGKETVYKKLAIIKFSVVRTEAISSNIEGIVGKKEHTSDVSFGIGRENSYVLVMTKDAGHLAVVLSRDSTAILNRKGKIW